MPTTGWKKRVDAGDWEAIAADVNDFGGALLPPLLTTTRPGGCASSTPRTTCSAPPST